MFVAAYLPAEIQISPTFTVCRSVKGFKTEDDAWNYIFSQMCSKCQKERQLALEGIKVWRELDLPGGAKDYIEPSLFPGCSCEWDVFDESSFTKEELNTFETTKTY